MAERTGNGTAVGVAAGTGATGAVVGRTGNGANGRGVAGSGVACTGNGVTGMVAGGLVGAGCGLTLETGKGITGRVVGRAVGAVAGRGRTGRGRGAAAGAWVGVATGTWTGRTAPPGCTGRGMGRTGMAFGRGMVADGVGVGDGVGLPTGTGMGRTGRGMGETGDWAQAAHIGTTARVEARTRAPRRRVQEADTDRMACSARSGRLERASSTGGGVLEGRGEPVGGVRSGCNDRAEQVI
jgi:hypothetical protein